MAERDQLGLHALQLLAEDWMVSVMRGLTDGPIRPAELERSLPHAGHSVVVRRLRRLLESELVSCEHQAGVPPHPGSAAVPRRAYYSLTDAGRMLLEITAAAERWEQTWCSQLERGIPPGIVAIGLSANRRTRKIMLALADDPLAVRDLHARLSELRHTTLRRRLSNLILEGLLERRDVGRIQLYELTVPADYIVERPAYEEGGHWYLPPLTSYSPITMQGFSNGTALENNPYNSQQMFEITNTLLASASGIGEGSSYQFTDTYHNCGGVYKLK